MRDPVPERDLVHHEEVVDREELTWLDTALVLELSSDLRPPLRPDRGIQRVVARARVEARPGELHLHDPLRELAVAPRVTKEVPLLVLFGSAVVKAVIARVVEQDIALPNFDPVSDVAGL